MKKLIIFSFPLILLFACGEEVKKTAPEGEIIEVDPDQFLPIEKRAKKHVMKVLGIPANENFSYKIHKKELNGDGKEDAIITVNRLEFAMDHAAKSSNAAKLAELGFMGNYNFFFYFDGSSRKISQAINVPSTPQRELDIQFEHITSANYYDIIVFLRVRNSCFADFYTIEGESMSSFFYWKVFDGIGTEKQEAYHFSYGEGKLTSRKNINISKGTLKLPKGDFDPYTVDPTIESSGELLHSFFFLPAQGKYVTMK